MTSPDFSAQGREFFGCEGDSHSTICEAYLDSIDHPAPQDGCEYLSDLLSRVHASAVEGCAKVAESHDRSEDGTPSECQRHSVDMECAPIIAAAIRALSGGGAK